MPDTDLKYRAFLSYSHADTGTALRVHGRLEDFHIDKELVGRVTPAGPIPKALRPIFRDRNDFDPGFSLGAETGAALDDSAALILLASPHAARSKYVNGEVRLFKSRHPDRPVIPLIIDGTPGDAENECFPAALRFAVTPDGTITEAPTDVLAADLRENGDGFDLALAKVVARLIGLMPDDVYRRAERERRRQARLRMVIVAVIALLVIVGGGLFWQSQQQKQSLNEIAALVDKYNVVTPAQAAIPAVKRNLTESITAIAEGAATDPRYAQALALLKAGKPDEAEPLLKAMAEDNEKGLDKKAKVTAAAYRTLASIAGISNPARARDYFAQAARLDPSNVNGMLLNGFFQEQAGQLDDAQAAFARVIAMAKPGADDAELVLAKFGIADIAQQRDDLGAALATNYEARSIAERLAQADPGNVIWQGEIGFGDQNIGDIQMAKGDLAAALKSYEAKREIIFRLAESDPGNAMWQYDRSVVYNKIGNVQMAQDHLPEALASYQASFAIRDRLAKSDPGNAGWQYELSAAYKDLGDVQVAQRNLPAALTSYQEALAIIDRLAQSDPDNGSWQRDLSVSYDKVGNVQAAESDLPAALTSYQASFAIRDRIAKSDPRNVGWQRDLSISHNEIGDVQMAQDNPSAALASYQASLTIAERLAQSDPGNASWQRYLSVAYIKIGIAQMAQGNLSAALTNFQADLAITERLAKSDPSNAGWQRNLQNAVGDIGDLASNLVFAREFTTALDAIDQAISVTPDQIWLYANRAHALMFLGRLDEARTLYLKYRGQTLAEQNGNSWEAAILEDFAQLRKAGLTNPLMDEIEKQFASAK
jgi:tetratricopeptide (TPR) repeat protein